MTTLRVALVIQQCKAGDFDNNLAETLDSVHLAGEHGADVVVFPEMNLTGYSAGDTSMARPLSPGWIDRLHQAAESAQTAVLAGIAEHIGNGWTHAAHLVIRPDYPLAVYRKIHLSPFEQKNYKPGNTVRVFEFKDIKFGVQLCYDAHFPELSTAMALKGADIIFFPHASPRGSSEDKFISWMRHLPARAFDNGIFVAAVNQTGENGAGLSFPGLALTIGPDGYLVSKEITAGLHMVEMDMGAVDRVRSHKMRYFLPNRRPDLIKQ
ncbi:MAG: amidohydrolase [Desulfobacter sp.]|nr:MAG: amidohydrolase [Desulfobacter sp.]